MLLDRVPLVSRSLRLVRDLATHGLILLERARAARLTERFGASDGLDGLRGQAQRFGAQAFARVASRWPALAELVLGIKTEPRAATYAAAAASAERTAPLDRGSPLDAVAARALLEELAHADAWQERASAAAQLAFCEGADVIVALRAALRDASAEVAVAAAEALAKKREPAAMAALFEVLRNAEGYFSPVTRVAALRALATQLRETELEPIVAALRDVDAEVSIAAIAALSEHGKKESTAPLLAGLLADSSGFYLPVVRIAAVNALLRLRALEPAHARSLLEREADPGVRNALDRATRSASLAN